jgi:hypothetical protein
MNVEPALNALPASWSTDDILVLATDACFDCAQACRACADACLGEGRLDELRICIQTNLDCADVCFATGDLAIRRVMSMWGSGKPGTGSDEKIYGANVRDLC